MKVLNPFKIKRPSPKLYVDYNNGVYVEKNKYGPTGKVDTRDLIDIICYILTGHTTNIKLFQQEMIQESLNIKY